ncbi:hypothetical protein WMY93_022327 [Mugilogobius chulae]|uniref:Uncharacterized protein n=1 Tax=Mugilogobius chulae TaxID=88201 RepID=A0AAW0N6M8_9GOBI
MQPLPSLSSNLCNFYGEKRPHDSSPSAYVAKKLHFSTVTQLNLHSISLERTCNPIYERAMQTFVLSWFWRLSTADALHPISPSNSNNSRLCLRSGHTGVAEENRPKPSTKRKHGKRRYVNDDMLMLCQQFLPLA